MRLSKRDYERINRRCGMKLSKRDLEKIWKIADVKGIPSGYRRVVYYDKQEKKFWGMLITSPTEINSPELVRVGEFISVEEYVKREFPDFLQPDEDCALYSYKYDFFKGVYQPPLKW